MNGPEPDALSVVLEVVETALWNKNEICFYYEVS